MKRFVIITVTAIILGATAPLIASGNVWSEVEDDVAYVHHDSAWFNCCAEMSFEIAADSSLIIEIFERDLGTHPCYCMCYYDFTHKLEGLSPGTYQANVWEASYDDPYTLAGSTTFTIISESGPSSFTTNMSECYGAEGTDEAQPEGRLKLEKSSLPSTDEVEISYSIPASAPIKLIIYDVTGNRVRTLEVGSQEQGEHEIVWDIRDDSGEQVPRGIYFVRLEAEGLARSLPVIVLR